MSNTERKNLQVVGLVIYCISKNNQRQQCGGGTSLYIDIISQTVFFLSLFLLYSITSSNAETTSRCPHCRPLTIFFLLLLLSCRYVDYACMYAHAHVRYVKKKGGERERKRD